MKELIVPIDQAGRIVLPKDIRREVAVKPGDTFKVSVHGSSVVLTRNTQTTGFIRKGKALVFSTVGGDTLRNETVSDILDETRAGRHENSLAGFGEHKSRT